MSLVAVFVSRSKLDRLPVLKSVVVITTKSCANDVVVIANNISKKRFINDLL